MRQRQHGLTSANAAEDRTAHWEGLGGVGSSTLTLFTQPGWPRTPQRSPKPPALSSGQRRDLGFHIGQTIDSTVEAINAGLTSLKAGHGVLGKVAVIVDNELAKPLATSRSGTSTSGRTAIARTHERL